MRSVYNLYEIYCLYCLFSFLIKITLNNKKFIYLFID